MAVKGRKRAKKRDKATSDARKKQAFSGRAFDITGFTPAGIQKNKALSDKSFEVLKLSVEELQEKYGLGLNEIISILRKGAAPQDILLPVSIFNNDELSAFETICKYLKENLNLTFHRIAELTKRDDRTIWTTYSNASKKRRKALQVFDSRFAIPVSAVADRRLSVLEAVVGHLKDEYGLRYNEISGLLNRDQRNIWTVYARARKRK